MTPEVHVFRSKARYEGDTSGVDVRLISSSMYVSVRIEVSEVIELVRNLNILLSSSIEPQEYKRLQKYISLKSEVDERSSVRVVDNGVVR